jgi:hypothetical protein
LSIESQYRAEFNRIISNIDDRLKEARTEAIADAKFAAKALTETMGHVVDLKARITALETLLKSRDANLYREYEKKLGDLKRNKSFETTLAGIAGLQQRFSKK